MSEERSAKLKDLLSQLPSPPVPTSSARPADWLWGQPTADPGTLEFGPALSEVEIAAWERRQGVALPPVLREAYLQQNGGMNRSQRLFLYRLEEWEPAGRDYFEEIGAEPPDAYDPALLFLCGYDDEWDASLFLAYRAAEDPAPVFYGYWSDGGSVAWTSAPEEILREEGR